MVYHTQFGEYHPPHAHTEPANHIRLHGMVRKSISPYELKTWAHVSPKYYYYRLIRTLRPMGRGAFITTLGVAASFSWLKEELHHEAMHARF